MHLLEGGGYREPKSTSDGLQYQASVTNACPSLYLIHILQDLLSKGRPHNLYKANKEMIYNNHIGYFTTHSSIEVLLYGQI